jgi:hypothetical protein
MRALVAIAPPFAGSPQVARVLLSGAEMVSRMIITDAGEGSSACTSACTSDCTSDCTSVAKDELPNHSERAERCRVRNRFVED